MKTLYININGESIQSDENIEVIGSTEDSIIDSFPISLGMAIADGMTDIKYKPLVADFAKEKPEEFKPFMDQWNEVKAKILGDNPSGVFDFVLSSEYLDWLKMNATYSEIYYKKYQGLRQATAKINLDELYEDTIDVVRRKVIRFLGNNENYKNFDEFVVNDNIVTRRSLLARSIKSKFEDVSFALYEKREGNLEKTLKNVKRNFESDKQDKSTFEEIIDIKRYKVQHWLAGEGLVYGFEDCCGREIIPCKYNHANDFQEGYAKVGIRKKGRLLYGYIDVNGNTVFPCECLSASDFYHGIAVVVYATRAYFINSDFKKIWQEYVPIGQSDYQNDMIYGYYHGEPKSVDKGNDLLYFMKLYGVTPIKQDGLYGLIDCTGKTLVSPIYTKFIIEDDFWGSTACNFEDFITDSFIFNKGKDDECFFSCRVVNEFELGWRKERWNRLQKNNK